jgi:uncharacterized Zn-finger protein
MKKLIFLADIDFDASPVVRAQVHTDAIADYAEAYKSKAQMPLPVLFQANGDKHLLVGDGRHRLEALRSIGKKAMECDVKSGSAEDAFRYALSANGNHGIRRTNADKRLCVELAARCWSKLSTKEMAEICAVSEGFVNSVRRQEMPGKGENEPAKEPASDSGSNESASKNKKRSSSKRGTSNQEQEQEAQAEADEAESQPPPVPIDEMGFPLPEVSIPFWNRRDEIQSLMSHVSAVRGALKHYQDDKDQMLCDLHNALSQQLATVYLSLADRKPYAVCPYCDGTFHYTDEYGHHDCKACHQTGLMAKALYDKVPPQFRARREKALK